MIIDKKSNKERFLENYKTRKAQRIISEMRIVITVFGSADVVLIAASAFRSDRTELYKFESEKSDLAFK